MPNSFFKRRKRTRQQQIHKAFFTVMKTLYGNNNQPYFWNTPKPTNKWSLTRCVTTIDQIQIIKIIKEKCQEYTYK